MQALRNVPSSAPAATARVLVERPPEGLLRGRESGPAWLLLSIAMAAFLTVAAFYIAKLRRKST